MCCAAVLHVRIYFINVPIVHSFKRNSITFKNIYYTIKVWFVDEICWIGKTSIVSISFSHWILDTPYKYCILTYSSYNFIIMLERLRYYSRQKNLHFEALRVALVKSYTPYIRILHCYQILKNFLIEYYPWNGKNCLGLSCIHLVNFYVKNNDP